MYTKIKLFTAFTFLLVVYSNTIAYTITVGSISDNTCNYNSIQAAINASVDYTHIGIASGSSTNRISYNEQLLITKPITLVGGFIDCQDASQAINPPTETNIPLVNLIGSTGNKASIEINHADVFIHNFEISGGNNSIHGGGLRAIGNDLLVLKNLFIHNNTSTTKGGGIFLNGTTLKLIDTHVIANTAYLDGGGIYCQFDGKVILQKNSGISFNQSSGSNTNGGGIYLNECELLIFSGTDKNVNPSDINSYNGISNNNATGHGGGIFAYKSKVELMGGKYISGIHTGFGTIDTPINLNNNQANSDNDNYGNGGGIYFNSISSFLATLDIHQAKIENNSAYSGGAIYLGENSTFNMRRNLYPYPLTHDTNCWSNKCSTLSRNKASYLGGAIYIAGVNNAKIIQTHITDNRANYGTVIAVEAIQQYNTIELTHNFIYHNGRDGVGGFLDRTVFDIYSSSARWIDLIIKHNTITDNHATNSVIALLGQNNTLKVFSSILYDSSSPQIGELLSLNSSSEFDCVNINETTSIASASLTRMNVGDPKFNVRNYDYHISANSPAIDYCDDSKIGTYPTIVSVDIDNIDGIKDVIGVTDLYGPWDLGADENYYGYPLDVIYIDSFDW